MEGLVQLRCDAAGHNAGLGRYGIGYQTRVKAYARIVDKELIGSADAGHASVFVHADHIVGVEIILVVDAFQIEKHSVVQPAGADGR